MLRSAAALVHNYEPDNVVEHGNRDAGKHVVVVVKVH